MFLMSVLFSILATIFAIASYVRYGIQINRGLSKPNPATILLWTIEGVFNTLTYFESVKDLWQTLITITNAILVFLIFFLSLYKRKFSKIGWVEVSSITLMLGICIFWTTTRSSDLANALLQVTYIISFIPVAKDIVIKKNIEHPLAWKLAVISYIFATLGVLSNYTGKIISLAYPVINGILGNGTIIFLIYLYKDKVKKINSLIP